MRAPSSRTFSPDKKLFLPVAGKVTQAGVPIKLSATPGGVRGFAPSIGADTENVLAAVGYGAEEIQALRQSKVV